MKLNILCIYIYLTIDFDLYCEVSVTTLARNLALIPHDIDRNLVFSPHPGLFIEIDHNKTSALRFI